MYAYIFFDNPFLMTIVYKYIYIYIYIYMYIHICVRVYMYIYMHVFIISDSRTIFKSLSAVMYIGHATVSRSLSTRCQTPKETYIQEM